MLLPAYRRRATPLHATRASVGLAFCAALALPVLLFDSPIPIVGALAAVLAAGRLADVGPDLRRSARIAVPIALLVAVVNPLVSQEGATLLLRGGEFLGRSWDVTAEAVAFGAAAGLRVGVLVMAFGLFSAVVDPDEVLRLFRRLSYRSALTAAVAMRLVPLLTRDARRRAEAARCRPHPPGRLALARAAVAGALDRAGDVAVALEVRGYATARPAGGARPPVSRHDVRFAGAALVLLAVCVFTRMAGTAHFSAYPSVELAAGAGEAWLVIALALLSTAPFAGRGARLGVARA